MSDFYSINPAGQLTIEAAPENQLVLTVDRTKVRLMEHLHRVGDRWAFAVPAGILATLIATLVTTDFKDALHVSKYTWNAVFIVSALVCTVWTAVAAIRLLGKKATIDDLIVILKEDTAQSRAIAAAAGTSPPLAIAQTKAAGA